VARIVVLGAGVVGLATGQGMASVGHTVTLVDSDPERVTTLRGLGMDAVPTLDLRGPSAIVFVALPTPATSPRGYDLSALTEGVTAIGVALREATARHTIVLRSTMPPLTTDQVVVPLLAEYSKRSMGEHYTVAVAPEFLRSASALDDVLSPWMTVLACRDEEALADLVELFRPFGGEMRTFTEPVTAELIKITHNAFNAAKISFWNEMWLLAEDLGIDGNDVSGTVALSAEGSTNPLYGIRGGRPYGSACLPKDVAGLIGFARDQGMELPLLQSVQQVNDLMIDREVAIAT
jgi:UDPglucose 6-dehydrogenase